MTSNTIHLERVKFVYATLKKFTRLSSDYRVAFLVSTDHEQIDAIRSLEQRVKKAKWPDMPFSEISVMYRNSMFRYHDCYYLMTTATVNKATETANLLGYTQLACVDIDIEIQAYAGELANALSANLRSIQLSKPQL